MTPSSHQIRIGELERLLAEENLSLLTRRLLDFTSDAAVSAELRRRAIILRADFNRLAVGEQDDAQRRQEVMEEAEALFAALSRLPQPETAPPGSGEQITKVPVFQGRGITKKFQSPGHSFVLPPLDVQLNSGEITGIVGENGNGKTTLLRIIAGELAVTGGELRYPGLPADAGDWYSIKQHIAYIPQQLTPWQGSLRDNLHFAAAIRGIKGAENEDLIEFVIHRLGLTRYEDAWWSEISSGYRLRFELARALVRRPTLLIIDEPLANLDIHTQELFIQDLRFLAASTRYPVSILLSSQHLHEVEAIADQIIFIKNGEPLYNGRMGDFGKDRNDNLFELGTTLDATEVAAKLTHIAGLQVETAGRRLLLRSPLGIEANDILGELVRAGIPVSYFRDISTSTLKLFRELKED
ncbi:MAG: ABC transporter ATP-binding protein [Bacteroidetes bacterium]|nr:MAG: ABC transporter ATP-binding protein [Bacteroidota bacterium]